MRTALPLLALAAAAPAAAQDRYHAVGTEPFWSVTIERGMMRLAQAGRRTITDRAPVVRPTFNGWRWEGRLLTVDATRAPCSDGMSDRRWRDTVVVTAGQRTLRGCGEAPAAGAALDGTRWRILAVDGRPVRLREAAELDFDGGRVKGRPGCNRVSGSYRMDGRTLAFAPLVATRMACPGEAMRVETRFVRIMGRPVTIERRRDGTALWRNALGSVTVREVP